MRPVRLELEGFASFRDRTVIEWDADTDVFVLTGPTGAGKSSIIDGITFALYGSVPRYANETTVEPVIAKRAVEAKVLFDFTAGADTYRVARVVRRSGDRGASTREARLERNGASIDVKGSRELDTAIQEILGLTFAQFTRCVVLPQGDFARFLHDAPKDRLDLLVKLLGVEFLRDVMQRANQRAEAARAAADMCQRRLDGELAGATREALDEAKQRVVALGELVAAIDADAPLLDELDQRGKEAARTAREAADAAAALSGIRAPEGIGELAGRTREADAAAERALALMDTTATAAADARAAREAVPWNLPQLQELERAYGELRRAETSRDTAEQSLEAAILTAGEAKAAKLAAASAFRAATEQREAVLNENYAYRLAQKLQAGDLCPVCGEKLAAAPHHEPPPGMDAANKAREAAEAAQKQAEAVAQKAQNERAKRQAELAERTKTIAGLEARLEGQPAAPEIPALRAEVEAADQAVRDAQDGDTRARRQHSAAVAEQDASRKAATDAWAAFGRACTAVAAFAPPEIPREDLVAAWATLTGWARAELPARQEAAETARAAATAAAGEREALLQAQRERCQAAGVDPRGENPRDACRAALTRGEIEVEQVEKLIATAVEVRRERAEKDDEASIATTLGQVLKADTRGFQGWYVERVLRRLVRDASSRMEQLSSNQYALMLDSRSEFAVIDHTNADEVRPVRTLSGGETFLASLSLALALSDNLVDMAANGAARLEAIFLDEGFGTLDPDTLDTVAAALEELGARGRMVGVVTHVQALAERLPVRYEVRKDSRTSKVERVVT
ncbi:MAG: SMC family ATPase [Dehalococcoidia bacterium]|nr:SMC family ATPase [Dehalococcoidia bacterium]